MKQICKKIDYRKSYSLKKLKMYKNEKRHVWNTSSSQNILRIERKLPKCDSLSRKELHEHFVIYILNRKKCTGCQVLIFLIKLKRKDGLW